MTKPARQQDSIRAYMAGLEARLVKRTGRTMAQWVRTARACPHKGIAERLKWLKNEHGLAPKSASLVLAKAFGASLLDPTDPGRRLDRLFSGKSEAQRPLYDKVAQYAARLGKGTVRPKPSCVGFYRLKQYAAMKPSRKGLILGIALSRYPRSARLQDVSNFAGDPRLRKALILATPAAFDAEVKAWLKTAYGEA